MLDDSRTLTVDPRRWQPAVEDDEPGDIETDDSWGTFVVMEIKMYLFFSMLAASTVGPGTVIVCSKAGADYDQKLMWTLVAASVVAFAMQEGAARFGIVSGMDLGKAMRLQFANGQSGVVPVTCFALSFGVLLGNTAYEANTIVGGMSALYVLYGKTATLRICVSLVYGVACIATLLIGDIDTISMALGVVVILMVAIFAFAVEEIGVDAEGFFAGFAPSVPSGAGVVVLSLIATTALPFNIFLASSMSDGYTIGRMRRGIGFSTFMAALLSCLIIAVGSSIELDEGDEFTVHVLAEHLRKNVGESAVVTFCWGLFAAAFSSSLTVALGASITAQSLLSLQLDKPARAVQTSVDHLGRGSVNGSLNSSSKKGGKVGSTQLKRRHTHTRLHDGSTPDDLWNTDGPKFRGIIIAIVVIGTSLAAAGVPTVAVVLAAQVINGLLLPFMALALLVVLNNDKFMARAPQSMTANFFMVVTVAVCMLLSWQVVVDKFREAGGHPACDDGGSSAVCEKENGTKIAIVFSLSTITFTPVAIWIVLKHLRRTRQAQEAADRADSSIGGLGSRENTRQQGTSLGGDYGMGIHRGRGCFSNGHQSREQINSRLEADPEAAPLVLASRRESQDEGSYV
jgi:Mn2+/Fe2+ NRAMP family transporter